MSISFDSTDDSYRIALRVDAWSRTGLGMTILAVVLLFIHKVGVPIARSIHGS
jgi:hypothetical protein